MRNQRLLIAGDVVIDQIIGPESDTMNFGGCGGNIAAYSGMLETPTTLHTVAGRDFLDPNGYKEHLSKLAVGMNVSVDTQRETRRNILEVLNSKEFRKTRIPESYDLTSINVPSDLIQRHSHLLLSVAETDRVVTWAEDFIAANRKFYFDLSNNAARLEPEDITEISRHSVALMLNSTEAEDLQDRTKKTLAQVLREMTSSTDKPFIIVTNEHYGATYYTPTESNGVQINTSFSLTDQELEQGDTLGCGDAFRAGLMNVIINGGTLPDAILKGHEMGASARKYIGAQGYIQHMLNPTKAIEKS